MEIRLLKVRYEIQALNKGIQKVVFESDFSRAKIVLGIGGYNSFEAYYFNHTIETVLNRR